MLKKLKSKLKSKSGLTLTEMHITVILLMFFSSACLLGISTALSTRREMIKAADSDILSSTIMQYISNELRLSLNPDASVAGVFSYDGGSTYANLTCGDSKIWLDDEGLLMRRIGNVKKDDDFNTTTTIDHEYLVFNQKAYSGFKLDKLSFTVDRDKDTITCSFVVVDDSGNEKKTEFTVTPLTPIE